MWLIWQELCGIVSDILDKIDLALGAIKATAQQVRADIAANYQTLTVMSVGCSLSLVLCGLPVLAILGFLGKFIDNLLGRNRIVIQIETGELIGLLVMLSVGCCVLWFTGELTSRIEKRLEGKPKDDQPSSTSTESES